MLKKGKRFIYLYCCLLAIVGIVICSNCLSLDCFSSVHFAVPQYNQSISVASQEDNTSSVSDNYSHSDVTISNPETQQKHGLSDSEKTWIIVGASVVIVLLLVIFILLIIKK